MTEHEYVQLLIKNPYPSEPGLELTKVSTYIPIELRSRLRAICPYKGSLAHVQAMLIHGLLGELERKNILTYTTQNVMEYANIVHRRSIA